MRYVLSWIGVLLLAASAHAEVRDEVSTGLGVYRPYPVNVVPNVETYTVAPDLSNVSNAAEFSFALRERELLVQNGFVAVPDVRAVYDPFQDAAKPEQIYDLYKRAKEEEIPIFVTTDALLHTFHVVYDYALRGLEVKVLADALDGLNRAMVELTRAQYEAASSEEAKALLRKNLAYFSVAALLRDPSFSVPKSVRDLVDAELALIDAHEGFAFSPIFGYREDYSQYVPRGHYTRSEVLKAYFRSMMWYGRMMLRLTPPPEEDPERGREETLGAVLIVMALKDATVGDRPAMTTWEQIYAPTVFFVGSSDDLSVYDYDALTAEVYGADAELDPDEIVADGEKLSEFMERAKALRNPLINSTWVWDTDDPAEVTKGFRFMGQRFIPDSYMFQQLVYDKVGTQGHPRLFPKGLDVLAVLGSERAYEILDEVYGETVYEGYAEQVAKLRGEFETLGDAVWVQNLYWSWLYSLLPLLEVKGPGFPMFMQTPAWVDKDLHTGLGSWTELRHDTILYAKQAYGMVVTSVESQPPASMLVRGYVEPQPAVFGRLASLAGLMREGLDSRGLLLDLFDGKLRRLEMLLVTLKEIAETELGGREPSWDQYETIATIGETLEEITTFPSTLEGREWESEADEQMAVVADVHTDPNTGLVLEEAVGQPMELYVIAPIAGRLTVTMGGMFSYYEFEHPMADRLTDEAWQERLEEDDVPPPPVWTGSFRELLRGREKMPPEYEEDPTGLFVPDIQVEPEDPASGMVTVALSANYALASEPVLEIFTDDSEPIVVPMEALGDRFIAEIEGSNLRRIVAKGVYLSGWDSAASGPYGRPFVYELSYGTGPAAAVEEAETESVPSGFSLLPNYPNPFNPETTLVFSVPTSANVELTVYDGAGQKVRTLLKGWSTEGDRVIRWDGRDDSGEEMSSGVYVGHLRVEGGESLAGRKMVLIR